MKAKKVDFGHILRIEKGEELIATLIAYCKENNIFFGSFALIGATTDIELGFFSLNDKKYHWKNFLGEFEITGGTGNITILEDEPMIHLHATLADENYQTFGGHVKHLIVGATCEVTLWVSGEKIERKLDEEVGLNLWEL